MTAITKMFLPSSYSLSKNSHETSALHCALRRMCSDRSPAMEPLLRSINVMWLVGTEAPKRSHGVTSWHHVASICNVCKMVSLCVMRLLSCMTETLGCPATVLCSKVSIRVSLNLEMRSFSYGNMILTLNQVWSTVSHSTLQPHQEYRSLALSENTYYVRVRARRCMCLCDCTLWYKRVSVWKQNRVRDYHILQIKQRSDCEMEKPRWVMSDRFYTGFSCKVTASVMEQSSAHLELRTILVALPPSSYFNRHIRNSRARAIYHFSHHFHHLPRARLWGP